MDWIPPELRENVGEIEAAIAQKLPHLIELEDIRGDIHMHTNLDFPTSHDMGASSIAELLAKAEELKYSFIGFSDHNPKRSGLDEKGRFEAVKKRNEQIDEEVQKYFGKREPTLKVFKGLEVDILTTGELALEDEALELLDYAIVSVHSSFANDRETNTQRILKGLAHPKVKLLGHPTGRLIEKRKGLEADWEKIAQFCADSGKFLEINSAPDRLDFPYDMVKNVKKTGVKFFINTDSHHVAGLDLMKFGVWTARKGWLTKKDVVNADENFLSGR